MDFAKLLGFSWAFLGAAGGVWAEIYKAAVLDLGHSGQLREYLPS